jgi:hypothetical protein
MDAQTILTSSSVLLGFAALGGLFMVLIRLAQKTNPPHWIAMAHGFIAAAGVTLLCYVALFAPIPGKAAIALLLLLAAALVGAWMNLGYHIKGQLLPNAVMIVHALVAVIGFLLLLAALFL